MIEHCKNCQKSTQFRVLYKYEKVDIDGVPTEYSFAVCDICNEVTLWVRENMGDGFENDSYYCLYPTDERNISFYLPDLVRTSYMEAVLCEKNRIWTATVVMVGRALEATCKSFVPDKHTLFEGLKAMREKNLINEELLEWANELRGLRNIGAHATNEKVFSNDATEALDFLQIILEILYHYQPKFNEMKNRRMNKNS